MGQTEPKSGDFVCQNCGYRNVPTRHAWCDCPHELQVAGLDDRDAALAEGWRDLVKGPGGVGVTISDADLEAVENSEATLETRRFHFGGLFSVWLFRVRRGDKV